MVTLLHTMQLAPGAYASPYLLPQAHPYMQAQMPRYVTPILLFTRRLFSPRRSNADSGSTRAAGVLSVDVAELAELRQSATLVAVDYSFGQFRVLDRGDRAGQRRRIESRSGGQSAGLLPHRGAGGAGRAPDAGALAAVQQTLNRLPLPFRLRCGHQRGRNRERMRPSSAVRLCCAARTAAIPWSAANWAQRRWPNWAS